MIKTVLYMMQIQNDKVGSFCETVWYEFFLRNSSPECPVVANATNDHAVQPAHLSAIDRINTFMSVHKYASFQRRSSQKII